METMSKQIWIVAGVVILVWFVMLGWVSIPLDASAPSANDAQVSSNSPPPTLLELFKAAPVPKSTLQKGQSPVYETAQISEDKQPKKYVVPDRTTINLAPSVAEFFVNGKLSDSARTLAFDIAWNLHQYTDGYIQGPKGGPTINEADMVSYINYHKRLWDKQISKESQKGKDSSFSKYFTSLLQRGREAFAAIDIVRIEKFHAEIHCLDAHLLRDDPTEIFYGATPFSTKR